MGPAPALAGPVVTLIGGRLSAENAGCATQSRPRHDKPAMVRKVGEQTTGRSEVDIFILGKQYYIKI
jgi:hypothetical protein